MNEGERTRLIIAIGVNLALGQVGATWLGLPRWAGTLLAGSAMAAATRPEDLPAGVRGAVQLIVLPGNLVAQALDDQSERIEGEKNNGVDT